MKLIVNKDRTTISVGTWGTVNENDYEILEFEFPEELEEYNKRIVYYLDDERVWDAIVDNKAYITNAVTKYEKVKAYVWLTKENTEREADTDFRTKLFEMKFYENENADGIVPTEEQVDGFNTMLTAMNRKIDEVNALEQTILQAETERQVNENTRISNESTRQSNESTRETNEQTRQSQEAERERRTNEAIADIQDKTAEYNANAEAKTNEFNQNATQKTNEFNSNYTQKVDDFNSNATTQTSEFNSNASSKTSTFNSNAETKTNAFNTNAESKTTEFNTNVESKTTAFNENATSKTNDFNDNATEKTTAYNTNAQNKIDEYDEHIADYQAQIDELQEEVEELSENMPWDTTEQATEISVDDAAKYSRNKLELFGNTEQDNTKMTYKCDGTETGDYYLTYDSTDYYFTMPTITEGDILVFDTTDLKLYLADTEITTESTGTGTNLTFIPSPNPDYPQDIHMVSGSNSIECDSKNLYNATTQYTSRGVRVESDTQFIYLDGKPTSAGALDFPIIPLKKGTYKIMFKLVSGSITSTSESSLFYVYGTTSTSVIRLSNNQKKNSRAFTLNQDGNMYIHLWARTTETFTNAKIAYQVVKGSTDDYNFVPYRLVTYPLELCIGKNRFNIIESKLGKYISVSGSVADSVYSDLSNYISVRKDRAYTLSFDFETLLSENDRGFCYYNKNKVFISGNNYVVANKLFTFTPAQDGYIRFAYDKNCYDIQVEEGDTATEYEPYNSLELCKIGDYQDYLYKENGNWYKYEYISKYVWAGETIRMTGNHFYIYLPKRYLRSASNYADRYIWVGYASGFGNMPNFHIGMEGATILHIQDKRFTTAAELKAEYEQNPLVVYMPLETPEITQITDETLISQLDEIYEHLKLVKGTNNITVTASDLAPYMQLSYMQDLPSKLDNLDSRLALLE